MSMRDIRNTICMGLQTHLQCPVVLSGQDMPENEYPYVYYQFIAPYIQGNEEGELRYSIVPSVDEQWEKDLLLSRVEHPQATISFSACAKTEDETIALAEKAQGYFVHTGSEALSIRGIVVVDVYDTVNRAAYLIDSAMPCWGFDVRIAYERADVRREATIEKVNLKKE